MARRFTAFAFFALLGFVQSAQAQQISANVFALPQHPSDHNAVAYDTVNHVYLLTIQGSPVSGKFLDKNGVQIGSNFSIAAAGEAPFSGWPSVAFGGPASDPVFLVTYTTQDDATAVTHTKWGRLVRFNASTGQPSVGPRVKIADIATEWNHSEQAQSAWNGSAFVIGSRVPDGLTPEPLVTLFQVDSNGGFVAASVNFGDGLDYYGSPAVACISNGTCMISGFAAGIPWGYTGGTYARLFNGATLAPVTSLFYLGDHTARQENQQVVYVAHSGQFLAAWEESGNVQAEPVAPNGTPGTRVTDIVGPQPGWAGDLALRYNAGTGSSLLATKVNTGPVFGLFVTTLADDGTQQTGQIALVQSWDGKWPEFDPSIAANDADGQWLVTSVEGVSAAAVVSAASGLQVSLAANMTSPLTAGMTVTWTASATGGTAPYTYQFQQWRPASGWTLVQDFSSSNTAYIPIGIGPSQVQVIAKSNEGLTASATSAAYQGVRTRAFTFTRDNAIGGVLTFDPSTGTVTPVSGAGTALSPITLGAGYQVYPGDFNGDGLTDFIAYNSATGDVHRYLNNRNNGFVDQPIGGTHTWGTGWSLTVVDFNADGYSDLFLYNPTSGAWWRFMSVGTDLVPYESGRWGPGWTIYVGDFNGDGYGDLFLFNKNSSADPNSGRWYRVLYNPAYGPNLGGFNYVAGDVRWASYWQVHTGDFNGDGQTDLFLFGPDGSWFKVYFAGGTAVYDGWQTWGKWASYWQVVEGNFTHDNMTDLLLYNPNTGRTILAKGQAAGFLYAEGPALNPGLQLLGTDFNADGLTDLWTTNPSDGSFVRFTLSGVSVLTTSAAGYFSSPGLTILSSCGIF